MALSQYKLNWQRRHRKNLREANLCVACGSVPEKGKKWCESCLAKDRKYRKESQWWLTAAGRKRNATAVVLYRRRLRAKVILAYGGFCSCCGEDEFLFLELDHVNSNGAEERRKYNNGAKFWLKIIREGFPDTYRVLCSNCNQGRQMNGGICPHQMYQLDYPVVQSAEGVVQ